MKAEIFNVKSDDDFMAKAFIKYVAMGKPRAVVHFEICGDDDMMIEFDGPAGMQLVGIAFILRSLSNQFRLDPVELGIKAGLMARQIDSSEAPVKKMDDKLTIKFNEEE